MAPRSPRRGSARALALLLALFQGAGELLPQAADLLREVGHPLVLTGAQILQALRELEARRAAVADLELGSKTGKEYAEHETVKHSAGKYVRYDAGLVVHTNTVENYFSVFKRGMRGTYQHCAEKHLHRYLAEFDFRYNYRSARGVEDAERAQKIARGAEGKRLTYRRTDEAAHA